MFQTNRTPEPRVVHEIRIGAVKAIVLAVRSRGGGVEHTVLLKRTESDAVGGEEESTALKRDDLLLAAMALDQAHAFICRAEGSGSSRT